MSLSEESRRNIIKHLVMKAHKAEEDVELLLKSESFVSAANRIYYGIFYIISALAVKQEFSTSKHSQLIGWFNKNYVRYSKVEPQIGRIIHNAFDQRQEADYNPLSSFQYDDLFEDFKNMQEVIRVVEKLINEEKST